MAKVHVGYWNMTIWFKTDVLKSFRDYLIIETLLIFFMVYAHHSALAAFTASLMWSFLFDLHWRVINKLTISLISDTRVSNNDLKRKISTLCVINFCHGPKTKGGNDIFLTMRDILKGQQNKHKVPEEIYRDGQSRTLMTSESWNDCETTFWLKFPQS